MNRVALALPLLGLCACATLGPERERGVCPDAIRVSPRHDGSRIDVDVANRCHVPMTVQLDFAKLANLRPLGELPLRRTLPAFSTARLISLDRLDASAAASYHPQVTLLYWGSVSPAPDDRFRYAFPFAGGAARRLVQGIGGSFTHRGSNRYAFDFDMPAGTEVVAARGGTVLVVFDGNGDGGPDPAYKNRGNAVFVLHDDGTIAGYSHLTKGVGVAEGARVAPGDRLGASGNSGYSKGPHLHFEVSTQRPGPTLESIPIRFRGDVVPVEGRSYGPYPGAASEAAR